MPSYVITPEQASRRSYRIALAEEIEASRFVTDESLKNVRINHQAILNYKSLHHCGHPVAQNYASWAEAIAARLGPRNRCLSLGSGIGRIERCMIDVGFTEEFEAIELSAETNRRAQQSDGRFKPMQGDLNFLELKQDAYDFVLCHGVLHHLINLEHVLHQIHACLRPGGVFLVYEYIGEDRWQFGGQRMSFLRKSFPDIVFHPPTPWQVSGFESIRSSELQGCIVDQFGEGELFSACYGSVYFPFVVCTEREADPYIPMAVELDHQITESRGLSPCYFFAGFERSTPKDPSLIPWSDTELDRRANPPAPLHRELQSTVKRSRVGRVLRAMKHRLR